MIPNFDTLETRAMLSPLTPVQIRRFERLSAADTGAGSTVAIVVGPFVDPTLVSDVAAFDREFRVPVAIDLTIDNLGATTDQGWSSEAEADIEMVHAVAPAANIVLVEAVGADLFQMMQADQAAGNIPGVTVVNNSWGVPEFGVDPSVGNYVDETYYGTRFLDPGVKYVAASGDNRVVQFPAADPLVISVGGLVVSGKRSHVWAGTGRGYSVYYPGHYVPDVYAPMSEAFYQGTSVSTAIVSGLIADGLEP